jgi:hypothetical protein
MRETADDLTPESLSPTCSMSRGMASLSAASKKSSNLHQRRLHYCMAWPTVVSQVLDDRNGIFPQTRVAGPNLFDKSWDGVTKGSIKITFKSTSAMSTWQMAMANRFEPGSAPQKQRIP